MRESLEQARELRRAKFLEKEAEAISAKKVEASVWELIASAEKFYVKCMDNLFKHPTIAMGALKNAKGRLSHAHKKALAIELMASLSILTEVGLTLSRLSTVALLSLFLLGVRV